MYRNIIRVTKKYTCCVQTMHEFEQLVDNGLEEAPVCSQEARILSNNVHDVRRDDCLVVFATFLFTQPQ